VKIYKYGKQHKNSKKEGMMEEKEKIYLAVIIVLIIAFVTAIFILSNQARENAVRISENVGFVVDRPEQIDTGKCISAEYNNKNYSEILGKYDFDCLIESIYWRDDNSAVVTCRCFNTGNRR
jgi:hypothetical protein